MQMKRNNKSWSKIYPVKPPEPKKPKPAGETKPKGKK